MGRATRARHSTHVVYGGRLRLWRSDPRLLRPACRSVFGARYWTSNRSPRLSHHCMSVYVMHEWWHVLWSALSGRLERRFTLNLIAWLNRQLATTTLLGNNQPCCLFCCCCSHYNLISMGSRVLDVNAYQQYPFNCFLPFTFLSLMVKLRCRPPKKRISCVITHLHWLDYSVIKTLIRKWNNLKIWQNNNVQPMLLFSLLFAFSYEYIVFGGV